MLPVTWQFHYKISWNLLLVPLSRLCEVGQPAAQTSWRPSAFCSHCILCLNPLAMEDILWWSTGTFRTSYVYQQAGSTDRATSSSTMHPPLQRWEVCWKHSGLWGSTLMIVEKCCLTVKKKKTKTWCQGLRASPLCSPFHLHSFGRETLTQRRWGGWPTYLWQLAELNWRLDTGTSAQNFRRVWAVFTDPNLEPGSRLLQHSRMVWLAGSCTVHKKAEILCSN